MKLRRSILYVLTLGLLCLYGGQCKKRRHHHKKLLAEDGANGDVAAAATSDAPGAAPVPVTGPVADQTAAAVTPADTNVPVVASAPQIVPQNAAPDPPPTAAEAAPAADTSTKEKIQKSDSDSKDANQKESYRWTNHSIPFLKRFKKEIDGGKIKHHNYEEMTWFLKYFAEEFPDITRLYSIGRSVQNRKLWVLEISDNPGQHDPGEPEMKYIGNVHGNEVIGREILLQLVKHLCTNYEDDADIKALVDNTRIHILPSLNPDGYELAATHKKSLNPDITEDVIGRLNANGVDLNRNFPDQFFEANTDSFEPESEAVMTWIRRYPFALSASFHSGALVVTYPFDDSPSGQTQYSATPDDDLFRQISKTYSENHPKMHLANPHEINCTRALKRFTDGISNGASWSPLTGGMQDYNYVRSNCYEVTVELGCEKFPREENLKTYWEENKKSLIKFIEFTNRGVKGFVKDHQGNPIKGARISVGDRKHDVRSAIDGDYFRLLVPGTYELECHAKGFKRNAANVEIPIGGQVVVNFTMLPKQIDELEEALGHVNKATLLSHDLMYRFDGRDSGNAAPKEVMAKVEAQRTGREWTTEAQDNLRSLGEDSSGSGDVAFRLAESRGFKGNYIPMRYTEYFEPRPHLSRRDKIEVPKKPTIQSRKGIIPIKKSTEQKKKQISAAAAAAATVKKPEENISHGGPKQAIVKQLSKQFIDSDLAKQTEKEFHILPTIGMHLRCALPKKQLDGTLQFLGYIPNLPKRNHLLVAGLEIETTEDLATDGTFFGKRYFETPPKRAYFLPFRSCKAA